MKRHNTIAAGVIGCFFAFGIAAQASAALITVDGPITDSMLLNADATATPSFGQALAITFTLDQDATNVSFTAAIDCSFCLGQIFLNRGIAGLGVESADLLAIGDFDSSTNTLFETGANSVLDFGGSTTFDLAAGTYSFGLIVTDDQASWFTSDMSTLTQAAGAACNFGQFAADANPTLPPQNNFTGGQLHFVRIRGCVAVFDRWRFRARERAAGSAGAGRDRVHGDGTRRGWRVAPAASPLQCGAGEELSQRAANASPRCLGRK